jgi:hypothetical protein
LTLFAPQAVFDFILKGNNYPRGYEGDSRIALDPSVKGNCPYYSSVV